MNKEEFERASGITVSDWEYRSLIRPLLDTLYDINQETGEVFFANEVINFKALLGTGRAQNKLDAMKTCVSNMKKANKLHDRNTHFNHLINISQEYAHLMGYTDIKIIVEPAGIDAFSVQRVDYDGVHVIMLTDSDKICYD